MSTTYLTHATLVLPDRVLHDSAMLIADGQIAAIEPASAPADAEVINLRGHTVMPGLIDVHCDAIEKEAEPRANVLFPLDFAVAQVDRRNAAAGITTPYHALSFASNQFGVRNNETAATLVRTVAAYRAHSLVDNRIHCRYEVTDNAAVPVLEMLMAEGVVDLLSVMDHSPGQGQFKTLDAYLSYMMGNHGMSREEAADAAAKKSAELAGATERVNRLVSKAHELGIPTASHDDDSPQRIAAMHALGVRMSEFPINVETAQAASAHALPTILGAPNVLRGKSQSGSMRAIDAIHAGVGHILCSDYQPSTLIAAAFAASRLADLPLDRALALVTSNPADACLLDDRGRLAPGKRADVIAVGSVAGQPLVTHTWSAGRLVFAAGYPMVQPAAPRATEMQAVA
ncbi:MAG: alpha-D-ribose 1-methylphosphonate 5-triphosphate diphosphatase [Burkholderiaceae bacterium]|jgi:alpha-D-ribose 1-methylphosphonate 5-triphosphate diphosphatase|uniref:Alpha-D-ribose 1-methylphosphonate 5-triphosphate diphosphatase n=1 Tax=Cupriavidus metallidurans TaxID=119219 RepID=A0A132HI17_9BURK|nr:MULTISPECIES: alpha-D-ribose 1-methylphosphonate 5-triphosphate diphosphatase [Cupriavidus]PCH57983.1 MAG: alpha-D-ribose 1-methylphosphonate 5-triphosphate diphosphatase [Burkholderiaceae bacterium]KWR79820.1 alpha-D-ribose 1-methylphosphonate 5-triphosphate diphosphatase [Cupriavidus sp. SHE]KWW36458.1 Alpha-D-ribose 1-methylphosphonate 5-triphosphate diphosphatase [Cupriavidus metallidurans]QBP08938.1 alpha-D-ribose 1-methylphosphonate 5-triphosphate diphosphatase [Cupriavidus metallidura